MYFMTQYYRDQSDERQDEIDACLLHNLSGPFFKKVFIFCVNGVVPEYVSIFEKAVIIDIKDRMKYSDAFNYATKHCKGEIVVLANSDILFDSTIFLLEFFDFNRLMLTISRREYEKGCAVEKPGSCGNKLFDPVYMGHDVWAFRAPLVDFPCDIYLGVSGCEHQMTYNAHLAGMKILSGYRYITATHYHATEIRNKFPVVPYCPLEFIRPNQANKLPINSEKLIRFLLHQMGGMSPNDFVEFFKEDQHNDTVLFV